MSWRITGRRCSEPGCNRPAVDGPLCRPHTDLAAAFGRKPDPEPGLLSAADPRFERELRDWLGDAA